MALKVVEFDAKASRNAEVVEMLTMLLEEDNAGDIIDLSFACSRRDGSTETGFTRTDSSHTRLSAVSMLQFRLQQMMHENSEPG